MKFVRDIFNALRTVPRCPHNKGTVGELSWQQTVCSEWYARRAGVVRVCRYLVVFIDPVCKGSRRGLKLSWRRPHA